MPVTPPTGTENLWARLWPTNVSQDLSLEELIRLLNRRFKGMPTPPVMNSASSRSIWNDVSQKMTLPELIRLINRRLGGIKIPMNEDALISGGDTDPVGKEALQLAGTIANEYYVGTGVIFQAGTNGNGWIPAIKRYARRTQGGYTRANEQLDPRALVDPRYPGPGFIVRLRDCLSYTLNIAIPNGAITFSSFWGYGGMPNGLSSAAAPVFPFVGFRVYYNKTAGNVVTDQKFWRCSIVNDQMVRLYDQVTTIDCQAPHEFQLVLDSTTKTVTWLIDGIQVGSYTFATNTAPGQVTPYPNGFATAAGAWNILWADASNLAAGNIDFCFRMSPATPMVSYEFHDR